jgi:hypothetical protein|tara:strand:- start:435 stop:5147 length:4713 start_codon:yes stop_codon:yes gene_type:complete
MTDSNLQNTVPEGAFGIGSKKTDDFTKNEELRNTGIQDIPNMLINALTKQSGGIVMPSQITEQTVTNFQEGVENVPLLRKEDEQTVRAGLAAGFDLTENAINFAGRAIGGLTGNKYTAKDFFNNEALGVYIPEEDENSLSYNLTKLGVQYGIPYTAAFKFLGSIGISNLVWKDVLAGGTTTSVFFDTFDKNLSNYLVDTPLVGPVAKLLAAESEEESNVAKETIKKFIEGGVTAKIANKTFDAVLNPQKVSDAFINVVDFFKKSPQATKRLIFNLQQSKFNKFSNIRKYNSMDEVLRVGDDLVDVAPVTDDVVTKTSTGLELPDTRGQNEFYHGAASEINLVEGGEFGKAVENLYGDGFYVTEDLITAAKYQKKNRVKGKKPTGIVYKVTEKQPVKFFDLDAPATPERIDQLRKFYDFGDYESVDIIDRALDEIGPNASIAQIYDQIKLISNANDLSANTTADLFSSFIEELQREGFGGLTHQGGKKAGKGKRLHQVRIYFDPANSLELNKVDLDQLGTVASDSELVTRKKIRSQKGKQKFQTTDTPVGFEGRNMNLFSDDPKEVAKIKAAYEQELNEYYPKYKNIVTDDMLIEDADDFLEQEVIQELKEFSDKYGFKLPVLMAASVRRISGLAENLSDGAKLLKTLPTGSEEAKILKSKLAIQTVNFYRLITGDSRAGTVVGRALRARQTAKAPNPVTGKTPGQITESNIQVKRAEEVKGGGSEVIRDIAKDIDDTFQNLGFTQDDLLKALEEDNFEGFADFASKLAAAHGDPFVLQKFVKESFAGKLLKIGNEQFINGILSNPATHARNTIGTMINVIKGPADLLAGSISREGLDPILFRRAMAEFAMFKQAQSDALKLAGQAFKDERNILDKSRMIVDSGNDPTQRFAIATQGGTYDGDGLQKVKSGEMSMAQYIKKGLVPDLINGYGTVIRSPTRALLAEDEYNKQLSFRMFLKGSLVEDGLRRGLDGKALDDYVDTSFELGTSWIAKKGEELDLALKGISESKAFIGSDGEAVAIGEDLFLKIRDALDYAADRTFTTRIDNSFVKAFKHPGWKPLIPFINTPLNLQQTLLKNTPMATKLTNNSLLKGMLDTHRKQLQSADPSVAARARGVTRVGGGIWVSAIGLSLLASNKFAKIALVDGNDPDWKEDKLRKYAGDIGYALRFLITNPITKEPELGPDGQPKYYFFDVGRIGLDPISSIFRAAGWWGTYSKYLSDDDQKNAALVMSTALARDILNIPMLENIQTLFDIIDNRPDALPNFIANYGNSLLIPFASLRRGLSKREYTIIDPRSGKKLKGFFKHDKSIQKGDYIKEEVRTTFDDGTPIPEDHHAYGTLKRQQDRLGGLEFFTKRVVLKMFKEIEASNPFKTDIQPERHWLTHQFLEYPKNLGPNSGLNPTYHGTSMNDPVISLMRRSRSKISKPSAHLFSKSAEGGILLDSTQYRTFTDLIGSIKLDDNGIESEKGKTVYERLYPLATNKNILKLLDFIDEGEVDEDFTIDTTALLTDRINTSRDLRSVLNKVIKPYIGTAKLKLFQLEDDQGGAKSLLPAYLKEKRRQELQIQNRNLR